MSSLAAERVLKNKKNVISLDEKARKQDLKRERKKG